jgi:anti-anti-sigma factor
MTWPCSASPPPVRRIDEGIWGSGSAAIESQTGDGTATIVIRGELDLVVTPLLCEHLAQILRAKPQRLILDLSRTQFIDCGSARIIADAGRLLPPGQRPVIRRPTPGVRRVFRLTGLDARCEIED